MPVVVCIGSRILWSREKWADYYNMVSSVQDLRQFRGDRLAMLPNLLTGSSVPDMCGLVATLSTRPNHHQIRVNWMHQLCRGGEKPA